MGPCLACQVGEEGSSTAAQAAGTQGKGDQNRSAQNRTYGVPAGRSVKICLVDRFCFFPFLFLYFCFFRVLASRFLPFPSPCPSSICPLLFSSPSRAPNSSLSFYFILRAVLGGNCTLLCACLRHCFWPTRTARVREGGGGLLRVGKGESQFFRKWKGFVRGGTRAPLAPRALRLPSLSPLSRALWWR